MGDGPVVLAILDHVRKDADGRLAVPVGLADGKASSLRFSEAAARLLILELVGAMVSVRPHGIPAVSDVMKRAGAEILASAVEMPARGVGDADLRGDGHRTRYRGRRRQALTGPS